jgi:DNA polymerase III gamma/tau subunit
MDPDCIADHLAKICDQESILYQKEALKIIAEMTECHVRDALKAVEGVSMLGEVNGENVRSYLHLDLNDTYLDIALKMVEHPDEAISLVDEISSRVAPTTVYEKLSDVCMLGYKVHLEVVKRPPSFWDHAKLKKLGTEHGKNLAKFALRLSDRPSRVTYPMLMCDLATITESPYLQEAPVFRGGQDQTKEKKIVGNMSTADGCYVDVRAIRGSSSEDKSSPILTPAEFSQRFELELAKKGEDEETSGGQKGRSDMGDPGTDETG